MSPMQTRSQQVHYTQQYHTSSSSQNTQQQQQFGGGAPPPHQMSGMQTLPAGTSPAMVMAAGQSQTLPHNMSPAMMNAQVWESTSLWSILGHGFMGE